MKKSDVKVGGLYTAKVSDRLVSVRIDSVHSREGWNATNTATGKRIHIKSVQRLQGPAKTDKREAAAGATRTSDGAKASEQATAKSAKQTNSKKAEAPKTAVANDAEVAKAPTNKPVAKEDNERTPDGPTPSERATTRVAKSTTGEKAETATTNDEKTVAVPKATTKKPSAEKDAKPKRMGALEAAAAVLKEAGKPMRATELIVAMAEQGLWESPAGSTPHATLYAAMLREARDKGAAARFKKVDRGLFAFNAEAKG